MYFLPQQTSMPTHKTSIPSQFPCGRRIFQSYSEDNIGLRIQTGSDTTIIQLRRADATFVAH